MKSDCLKKVLLAYKKLTPRKGQKRAFYHIGGTFSIFIFTFRFSV